MQNQPTRKILYPYLTYAGTLPFILCTIGLTFNIHTIAVLGSIKDIFSAYGLVIASFMAGCHWGQHLNLSNKWNLYLPLSSNIIAVTLWICFLLFPFAPFLVVLAISFTLLLFIDKQLLQIGLISGHYFHTRCIVTFIVITTIIISGLHA